MQVLEILGGTVILICPKACTLKFEIFSKTETLNQHCYCLFDIFMTCSSLRMPILLKNLCSLGSNIAV